MLKEAVVDFIPSDRIVTAVAKLTSFNLYTCNVEDVNFDSTFELVCYEEAELTCLVGYFDTIFNLQHKVQFSTGPFTNGTHWKQTLFYIENPVPVKKGLRHFV